MGSQDQQTLKRLALAQRRALQLQRAMHQLLNAYPDAHPTWLLLAEDADRLSKYLGNAGQSMSQVLTRDPYPSQQCHISHHAGRCVPEAEENAPITLGKVLTE
ncbi:MAG TPA: hypothetical protein VF807_01305 [Ktedonobacterales bacterium]